MRYSMLFFVLYIEKQSDSQSVHASLDVSYVGHTVACYVAMPKELPFFCPGTFDDTPS